MRGEVIPARPRRAWLTIPSAARVPRRAIFAAGLCAGLAAPALARHLVGRALGMSMPGTRRAPASVETATLELIRVSVSSTGRGEAAAALARVFGRRG